MQDNDDFNLLPKEVFKKRERTKKVVDRSALYTAFLPFIVVVIWLVFAVISSFIQSNINRINGEIAGVENEIASFDEDKELNALLVLKTRLLTDVVARDVNPENFFTIVEKTIEDSGLEIGITKFGREGDGAFSIEGSADNTKTVTDIARIFREHEKLTEFKLNSTTINSISPSPDDVNFKLEFVIVD